MIQEQEFLTCKIDQVFKTVVIDEKDYSILEAILSNILGGNPKVISLPRTVIKKDTSNEKSKDRDLVVELNGTFINLEVVTGHGKEVRSQLFTYHVSMWKQNIIKSEKYDTKTIFLQIILQYGLSPKKPLIKSYKMQHIDKDTREIEEWIPNFETLQINMERLKEIWYSNSTSDINKYKYLIMLDMKEEDLEKLGKEDKIVEEYKEKVCALNNNPNFINTITKEREKVLMHNTALELAYEDGESSGFSKGISAGILEGISEGEKKKQLEIAKKMLSKNKTLEEIMELTELTKEEIEHLKNTKDF